MCLPVPWLSTQFDFQVVGADVEVQGRPITDACHYRWDPPQLPGERDEREENASGPNTLHLANESCSPCGCA